MSSNVGFKSSSDDSQGKGPRKKAVSRGLLVTAVVFFVTIAIWGGIHLYKQNLSQERMGIEDQISQTNKEIRQMLDGSDVSDFAGRADIIEKGLYRGYDTNDVLKEVERIMIMKDSDGSGSRVVLRSFQHRSTVDEDRVVGDGSAVSSGGSLTITADADTFDVMAQQVEMFKRSEMFTNIVVGTTDRDDSNRLVFTLMMDVVSSNQSPFQKNDGGIEVAAPPVVEVEDGSGTEVTVSGDDVSVSTQSDGQAVNTDASGDGANVEVQQ